MFGVKTCDEKGFTLIELMVVVVIIGVLATIAIPQFAEYRRKSYDAVAKADLSSLAGAMEHYYVENSTYPSVLPTEFKSSSSVTISIVATSVSGFTATATHSGSTNTFTWISDSGGLW